MKKPGVQGYPSTPGSTWPAGQINDITPLSAQISASKFQNLSQIPPKIRGVWKIVVFDLKLTQNLKTHSKFENSLKILKLTQIFGDVCYISRNLTQCQQRFQWLYKK